MVIKMKLHNASDPLIKDRMSEQEHDKLTNLFRNRGKAIAEHEALLKADAQEPDDAAFHSIARHGPQTGWEAQLIRLVTGRTPDQPEDPFGVGDAVTKYEYKESLPQNQRGKTRYAVADSVGAFLSPEVEVSAISMAKVKAAPLMGYRYAETKSKAKPGGEWHEFRYIDVILPGTQACTGVSFVRVKHLPKIPQAQAVQAIKDFMMSKRLPKDQTSTRTFERSNSIIRDAEGEHDGHSLPHYRAGVKRDFSLRFPSMQNLLDYLNVKAVWMTHVNVCLRRIGEAWQVHTAYPVGSRLESKVGPYDKDVRHQDELTKGMNVRGTCKPSVKSGKWTGNLRKVEDDPISFIDPASLL